MTTRSLRLLKLSALTSVALLTLSARAHLQERNDHQQERVNQRRDRDVAAIEFLQSRAGEGEPGAPAEAAVRVREFSQHQGDSLGHKCSVRRLPGPGLGGRRQRGFGQRVKYSSAVKKRRDCCTAAASAEASIVNEPGSRWPIRTWPCPLAG